MLWDEASACWRDGVIQQQHHHQQQQQQQQPGLHSTQQEQQPQQQAAVSVSLNPAVLASNYVPLWAGLAGGDEELGVRVVASLEASGLVQPGGELTGFL